MFMSYKAFRDGQNARTQKNTKKNKGNNCLPYKKQPWKLLITLRSGLSDLDVAFCQLRVAGTYLNELKPQTHF